MTTVSNAPYKPPLDALRDIAGFRISDVLYRRVLQDEGEESAAR